MKLLPATGTAALLEIISPHISDDLINSLWIHRTGPGRPRSFWPSQLFRVSLLPLLTPARSFNLIVQLLGEQRALRSFARLPNRLTVPDVRMLHEFRDRLNLTHLRRINEFLLEPLIEGTGALGKTVALIDSTDLPAATNTYKKTFGPIHRTRGQNRRAQSQRRAKPLFCRIQKAHASAMAWPTHFFGPAGASGLMGGPGQSRRFGVFGAEHSLLPTSLALDS
jgi:hypothetical protein